MKNVIWLSRHPLNEVQVMDLEKDLRARLNVVSINALFPARAGEASNYLSNLLNEQGMTVDVVAGVFPAHVALALKEAGWKLALPVSKPAPAVHGEERRFEHSHWELF